MREHIEDVKMPGNCFWECPFQKEGINFIEGIYYYCSIVDKRIDDGREDWCPLVKVKNHDNPIVAMKEKESES